MVDSKRTETDVTQFRDTNVLSPSYAWFLWQACHVTSADTCFVLPSEMMPLLVGVYLCIGCHNAAALAICL
jgi:hypothetical protein